MLARSPARRLLLPDPLVTPPIALTIGGSDSGGGAGIQADLKTFMALEVHGCSAITCVTAQNTTGVSRVDALPPAALVAQIEAVMSDLPVAALKTGMLLNAALIEATAAALAPLKLPRLIDPVIVSRAGSVLLEADAIAAYRLLLPLLSCSPPTFMRRGCSQASPSSRLPMWSGQRCGCSRWVRLRCSSRAAA